MIQAVTPACFGPRSAPALEHGATFERTLSFFFERTLSLCVKRLNTARGTRDKHAKDYHSRQSVVMSCSVDCREWQTAGHIFTNLANLRQKVTASEQPYFVHLDWSSSSRPHPVHSCLLLFQLPKREQWRCQGFHGSSSSSPFSPP